ncbi:MAG: SCO family protein [Hyphomonas sp.]
MRLTALSIFLAAGLAACSPAAEPAAPTSSGDASSCLDRAYPEIGGPISLVSSTGARVTEADFKGRYSLIYFGFTYCPDVCPLTLTTVTAAYRKLPEGMTPPQMLLISVDPERDTPEALATYLANKAFPAGSIGLTGTEEDIRAAADAFKADYSRVDQPDSLAEYTMDHTSLLYLMDENWQLKTFFTHQDTPDTIAACLQQVME